MATDVRDSYARRAVEYAEQFGSIAAVHPSDLALVTSWASEMTGPLLDAGCGPGLWTAHLAELGHDILGVDQVPEFVDRAREAYPHAQFELADIDALPDKDATVGGILAWYSLIHHEPSEIQHALAEFARVLKPAGGLLLGFFTGRDVEAFEHAVTTAYRWPPEALAGELQAAGFEVVETHTRTGNLPKPRPHGAIVARLATG
jgi:SAM-dependent methyltransferase